MTTQALHAPPIGAINPVNANGWQYEPQDLIAPSDLPLNRINQLVYGDFGCGKTTYAATAPNCLLVESERGEASLRTPFHPLDPRSRIKYVNSWDDMRDIYQRLRGGDYQGFESVMIDSLSDLQEKCLFEVMAAEEVKNPKRPKGVPQRNDYQIVTNTMRRMMIRFRDLDKNVIFVAQYRNDKANDFGGGGSASRPIRAELTPAVYKGIAGYVDILSYMTTYPEVYDGRPTGRMQYALITADPSMQYSVKSRYRLPPYIIDPTFQKVVEAIGA